MHNYNQYDVDDYGKFNNAQNRGDNIDGHEVIQNAWLEKHGYTYGRGSGISRKNVVVGLTPDQHAEVTRLQREAGMFDSEYLKNVSWKQNLHDNLVVLMEAGVPQAVIDKLNLLASIFGIKNKL